MKILKAEFKNIIMITLGIFIFTLGLNLFLKPAGVYTTGLLGLSQEISTLLNYSFIDKDISAIIFWVLNIPIILLGWFKVGKKFTLRTFYAVTLTSLFSGLVPVPEMALFDDKLVAIITSGLFMGTGLGFCLKSAASTGGTDILAVYISLTKGKGFGTFNIMINVVVILIAIFITKSIEDGVYMLITLYTMGVIADKIHNSHEKISLFIVSQNPQAIRDAVFNTTMHTCTIIDSIGGRDGSANNVVMTTVSKSELYKLVEEIHIVDSRAWINVLPVESVVGYFENNLRKNL